MYLWINLSDILFSILSVYSATVYYVHVTVALATVIMPARWLDIFRLVPETPIIDFVSRGADEI